MRGPATPTVMVVTWRFPVFSETFVVDHLLAMLDRGWRVSVACVELDEAVAADHRDVISRLERLTVFGTDVASARLFERIRRIVTEGQWRSPRSIVTGHAARLAPALRRELAATRPDVVHAHFGLNAAAAALAVGTDDTPVVADLHGFDITEVPHAEGWGAYRRLLTTTTIVVHSRFAADLVRSGLGVEPEVIPLDPSIAFEPVDRPDRWTAPLRLLFVGRLVPDKGADVAIAALARLRERQPELDARLTVVGRGPVEGELRAQARHLEVDELVVFAGALAQGDVARTMATHDVLVVPSRPSPTGWVEAFGLVAAEGARSGMGVVVSRLGGLPEAAGPAGVAVEPGDPLHLTAGIEQLLDRGPAATSAAATAPVAQHRTAEHYDRLARRLLAERDGGRSHRRVG